MMRFRFIAAAVGLLVVTATKLGAQDNSIPVFPEIFRAFNGTFLLYDSSQNTRLTYNEPQSRKRLPPCSTFKILNSLIGLETGVIADENFEIPWDGSTRDYPELNRNHSLQSAFRHSVVWYYQELARRVGKERMKQYVEKTGYGNCDVSGPIDLFWLMQSLEISASEQLDFLVRLYRGELPFAKRSIDIVKKIMIIEQNDSYIFRGKTGSGLRRQNYRLGWFAGYLEYQANAVFFVIAVEDTEKANGATAREMCITILKTLGYL